VTPSDFRFGLRVVGSLWMRRRLVDHSAALRAYAECDSRADLDREGYLSAFRLAADFRRHFEEIGRSELGYVGPSWADWLWLVLDSGNLSRVLADARRLVAAVSGRFPGLADDDLLLFFSGAKGFHVGIPTAAWGPAPAPNFHRTARRFCARLAALANLAVDESVYSLCRLFRAPNSTHPKTGLRKRRFTFDEFMDLSLDAMLSYARSPEPFEVPSPRRNCDCATQDWADAAAAVEQEAESRLQ
jgi:hypothetical protein